MPETSDRLKIILISENVYYTPEGSVSILVLMEVELKPPRAPAARGNREDVSILVLMEVELKPQSLTGT